jgi:GTP cyclohydrolase IA
LETEPTVPQDSEYIVKQSIYNILKSIGENPDREGLLDTPKRVAKSYKEIFGGYEQNVDDILTTFENEGYDEMVTLRDIEFYSTCEHHMLPFMGTAHISYIPSEKIVGLSKLARVLDVYSKRLQVQERLTTQVADILLEKLNPKGVAVMLEAKHFCMLCRGARKQNSKMVTTSLKGVYNKPEVRAEFLNSIK